MMCYRTDIRSLLFACLAIITTKNVIADEVVIRDELGNQVYESQMIGFLEAAPAEYTREALGSDESVKKLLGSMLRREMLISEADKLDLRSDPVVALQIKKKVDDILISALKKNFIKNLEEPDFTKIAEEYYKANPKEFLVDEKRLASHILIKAKTDAEKKEKHPIVEDVLVRLKAGETFSDLAKELSNDGSAKKGGDLGWVRKGRMVKPFEEALFALAKPGDISGIVETRFGLHVIQLNDIEPQITKPFDDVKKAIIERQRAKYHKEKLRSYLENVTELKSPVINGDVVDGVKAKLLSGK